jgi:aminocarboxymuconate-semialdehyde decarboxylase
MFGANRIAVGSDYPFPLGEDKAGELVKNMNLDFATKKQILETTALEWLGVDRGRFI